MNREPDNFLHDLPIDIDTLAALVEGDLGSDEADAVRERLLVADPELAHRVELMCQDRVMLRTLGDEQPPSGLAESVIVRLEREALLGLAGADSGGAIPLSRVRTVRPSRWAGAGRWLTTPAGAGLAMAAGLALAIGSTLRVLPKNTVTPLPEWLGAIALNNTEISERGVEAEGPVAKAVLGTVPDAPAGDALADTAAKPAPQPAPEMVFTSDWDRALALLAEGRLLVGVRSVEPETTMAQIDRLRGWTPRPGEAWGLDAEVAEPVATAMHARFEPVAPEVGETAFAAEGDDRAAGAAPRVAVAPRPSALEAIYMADARADTAAMASLRAALSVGDGQTAVFEELAEPLELPRVLTPESVLWWGRPADEWVSRAFVPVVIERVER